MPVLYVSFLYSDDSPLTGFYWDELPADNYGYVDDYENVFTDGQHILKRLPMPILWLLNRMKQIININDNLPGGIDEPDIDRFHRFEQSNR